MISKKIFSWFCFSFNHKWDYRETISRKYLTTRYFPFPYLFFDSFHFFISFVELFLFFLIFRMTALVTYSHTLFFSLKYYSSEKRFFNSADVTHAKKPEPLGEGLASLHFFWPQASVAVLVLASNSHFSSKVPKCSVGLYEWSMALPSVFPPLWTVVATTMLAWAYHP